MRAAIRDHRLRKEASNEPYSRRCTGSQKSWGSCLHPDRLRPGPEHMGAQPRLLAVKLPVIAPVVSETSWRNVRRHGSLTAEKEPGDDDLLDPDARPSEEIGRAHV